MVREQPLPYRTAGEPHLAIRRTLNMKAPFAAGGSELLSMRLWPFSARAREIEMRLPPPLHCLRASQNQNLGKRKKGVDMEAYVVEEPGGPFRKVQLVRPNPGINQV